jgi:hypothetical protein
MQNYLFALFIFVLAAILMCLYFFLSNIFGGRGLREERKKLDRICENLEKDAHEYKNALMRGYEEEKKKMESLCERLDKEVWEYKKSVIENSKEAEPGYYKEEGASRTEEPVLILKRKGFGQNMLLGNEADSGPHAAHIAEDKTEVMPSVPAKVKKEKEKSKKRLIRDSLALGLTPLKVAQKYGISVTEVELVAELENLAAN